MVDLDTIKEVRAVDLLTYLQVREPNELVRGKMTNRPPAEYIPATKSKDLSGSQNHGIAVGSVKFLDIYMFTSINRRRTNI